MDIQHFDDLLRSRAASRAQQLLFVFAGAELPADASAQQRADFDAGEGGALAPLMCVDKPAAALHGFDGAGRRGRAGRAAVGHRLQRRAVGPRPAPPSAVEIDAALQHMVESIKDGPHRWRCCPSTATAMPVRLGLKAVMPDDLLQRLRRFHEDTFPGVQDTFEHLVKDGQHPTILFIGCRDSRLVPYLLTGTGPGDLFLVRNVGAFVPPHDMSAGFHGTAAAIEFAVLNLNVQRIIVCGHSHCGGIRALYEGVPARATNLAAWLELGREAVLPVQLRPRRCAVPNSARWCCSSSG